MKNLLLTLFCFIFIACVNTPEVSDAIIPGADYFLFKNEGKVSNVSPVALAPVSTKDFITKGIIFVTSSVKLNTAGNVIDGSKITFEMIMKEVQKLNADDFINLRIDEIHTISTTEGTIKKMVTNSDGITSEKEVKSTMTGTTEIVYKATAVAIKYSP